MSDCARSLKSPVGLPSLSFRICPPAGSGVVLCDFGHLHRQRVGESGVPAGMRQPHRVVGRHAAQRLVQRKAFDVRRRRRRPFLLVPAAAEDPFARPRLLRRVADHPHDVVPVLAPWPSFRLRAASPTPVKCDVRVDEPGHRERALEIDDPRRRADVPLDLLVGSERDDRVADDGDRLPLPAVRRRR